MFTMEVDADRAIARNRERLERVPQKLGQIVTLLTLKLLAAVQTRAPVLTGKLRRSIFQEITLNPYQALGKVYVSPDTPYARIQEYGGTTPPHDIFPNKASVLAFMIGGKQIFARSVHHPGSKIPALRYVHGPFEEMKPEIVARIKGAVGEAIR